MNYANKGEWLTKLLEEAGMTPADLARASGLDSAVISNIQNGKRGTGTKTASKIARAVRRPTEYILRLAGELENIDSTDELVQRADYIIKNYKYPQTKEKALEYLEFLAMQEEKAEYRVTPSSKPAKEPKPK